MRIVYHVVWKSASFRTDMQSTRRALWCTSTLEPAVSAPLRLFIMLSEVTGRWISRSAPDHDTDLWSKIALLLTMITDVKLYLE